MRVLLVLISLLLAGCQSLQLETHMDNRDPIGTFKTSYLDSQELVDCLNMNQPPKPETVFDGGLAWVWLSPTKYKDGSTVIYFLKFPTLFSLIHQDKTVEFYSATGFDEQPLKEVREHYQSVC